MTTALRAAAAMLGAASALADTFLLTVFQPKIDTLAPTIDSQMQSLARAAAEASAAHANLLVVPELFMTGYNLDAALASEPRNGTRYAAAGAIAAANNVSIVFTYPERGADGRTYDSAVLFGRDGAPRLDYRKTNLAAGEGLFLTGGDLIGPVVEVDGVRVGILICFDIYLPEPARILSLSHVDLIVVPTANGYPPNVFNQVADLIVPARALENDAFVAYVNSVQVGPPGKPFPEIFSFYGHTTVADPGGSVIYTGPSDAEAIAHVQLNFTAGSTGMSTAIGRPPADTRGLCDPAREDGKTAATGRSGDAHRVK
jgi:predicted amidohydrolase